MVLLSYAEDPAAQEPTIKSTLTPQMFSVQQMLIDPAFCRVLKDFEKAMLRKSATCQSPQELLEMCHQWFLAAHLLQESRRAREEAWRLEFTGRKGELHELFDRIDIDGDGSVTLPELREFFNEFGSFFGYNADVAARDDRDGTRERLEASSASAIEQPPTSAPSMAPAADELSPEAEEALARAPEAPAADMEHRTSVQSAKEMLATDMPTWLEEESKSGNLGPEALFERLDRDKNGAVEWPEFWTVINEWLDEGFDRIDELRSTREARMAELERKRVVAAELAAKKSKEEQELAAEQRRITEAARAERAALEKERREAERKEVEQRRKEAREEAAERARRDKEREEERKQLQELEKAKQHASARAGMLARQQHELDREADRMHRQMTFRYKADALTQGSSDEAARRLAQGRWRAALASFEEYAVGGDRSVAELCDMIVKKLLMGEPDLTPAATVVAALADEHVGAMQVASASTGADEQLPGQAFLRATWPEGEASGVAAEAFKTLASGEIQLWKAREGSVWGMAPLKELSGRSFGVVVSGPPAVPVEFLEKMAVVAGPRIERAWRHEQFNVLLEVAKTWVHDVCGGALASVELVKADKLPKVAAELAMPLRWLNRPKERLGVLTLRLKEGRELDELTGALLGMTGPLLQDCVHEIERMRVGEASPVSLFEGGAPIGVGADAGTRMLLPRMIMSKLVREIEAMDAKQRMAELRSYHQPPPAVHAALEGVLCVLGRRAADLSTWPDVRAQLTDQLPGEIAHFDPAAKGRKRPWLESKRATQALTAAEVLKRGSGPVTTLFKWLEAARLVRKVAVRIRKEAELAEAEALSAADSEGEDDASNQATLTISQMRAYRVPELDVAKKGKKGASDPYVQFKLLMSSHATVQTKYIENVINPVWKDEVLRLVIPRGAEPIFLVTLLDKDWTKEDDVLATAEVRLPFEGAGGNRREMLSGEYDDYSTIGEDDAGPTKVRYEVPFDFVYEITPGPPPPAPAQTLVIHAQKAYRTTPSADSKPRGLKKGASMAALSTAPELSQKTPSQGKVMEGSEARMVVTLLDGESGQGWLKAESPQVVGLECPAWPEELRLPLAAGSARPPRVRFQFFDIDRDGKDDEIATADLEIGTAPVGREKLYLTGLAGRGRGKRPRPAQDVKFIFSWRIE